MPITHLAFTTRSMGKVKGRKHERLPAAAASAASSSAAGAAEDGAATGHVLSIIRQLSSTVLDERIAAVMSLASILSDSASPALLAKMERLMDSALLPLLLARLEEGDPRLRLHTLGALRNLTHGGHASAVSGLTSSNVIQKTVSLINDALAPAAGDGDLALAIACEGVHLLHALCVADDGFTAPLARHAPLTLFHVLAAPHAHDDPAARRLRFLCMRLLHAMSENNPDLNSSVAGTAGAVERLQALATVEAGAVPSLTTMHAIGVLVNVVLQSVTPQPASVVTAVLHTTSTTLNSALALRPLVALNSLQVALHDARALYAAVGVAAAAGGPDFAATVTAAQAGRARFITCRGAVLDAFKSAMVALEVLTNAISNEVDVTGATGEGVWTPAHITNVVRLELASPRALEAITTLARDAVQVVLAPHVVLPPRLQRAVSLACSALAGRAAACAANVVSIMQEEHAHVALSTWASIASQTIAAASRPSTWTGVAAHPHDVSIDGDATSVNVEGGLYGDEDLQATGDVSLASPEEEVQVITTLTAMTTGVHATRFLREVAPRCTAACAHVLEYATLAATLLTGGIPVDSTRLPVALLPAVNAADADLRVHAAAALGGFASPRDGGVYLLPHDAHAGAGVALTRALGATANVLLVAAAGDALMDAYSDEAHDDAFHAMHALDAVIAALPTLRAAVAALDEDDAEYVGEVGDNLARFVDYKRSMMRPAAAV